MNHATTWNKGLTLFGMTLFLILSGCGIAQTSTERDTQGTKSVHGERIAERDESGTDNGSAAEPRTVNLEEIRAEFAVTELPDTDQIRGGELLEGLHPELKERAKFLYALLEAEGIDIVFISGYRPINRGYLGRRLASWHNVGLAFDLNFVGRTYKYYEEDEEKWNRVGEIAMNKMGIIWGRMFDDIWHFEWHPGFNTRIRQHEADRLTELAGEDLEDYQLAFGLFDPDPEAAQSPPPCFGGCKNIPHQGLRALFNDVRTE